jgi:Transposase DDE domain
MQLTLISLYYYVCERYNSTLRWQVQRFSPNFHQGNITDEEIITIYLFCVAFEEKTKLKSMHKYILNHWVDWFPHLPTYETFVSRINRISVVFPTLVASLLEDLDVIVSDLPIVLTDSMPIVTCSAKRKAKVALEMVDKGFCSTKQLHYFGVKLHLVAKKRENTLPLPEYIGITPASMHDLTAIRPILETIKNRNIIADKAYFDEKLNQKLQNQHNSQIITPIKGKRNTPQTVQQYNQAFNDLFSTAVSKIRQPIESFFNWIQEKTNIQFASKVRSAAGLVTHVFGKIAAALCIWMNF